MDKRLSVVRRKQQVLILMRAVAR